MLNVQYYSWEELESLLNVQFTKKNGRAKLIDRNIAPLYEYEIVKDGRKSIGLNIIGFKEKQKSNFIKFCEEVAGFEVSFPNEETAEKLLRVLKADDKTIFSYEELGKFEELERYYTRQTISIYMRQFQEIGIIPKRKKLIKSIRFNAETGELLGKAIDPNKWTYYKVYKNERTEITYLEYREMFDYITELESNLIMPLIDEANGDAKLINSYKQYCYQQAIFACIKKFGFLPKRTLSKALTAKAQHVFENYFNNKTEEQTVNIIQNIQTKKDELIEMEVQKHPFKQFIMIYDFMQFSETIEEEVIDMNNLRIEEDPFTGRPIVFNEQTQNWEDYHEDEWIKCKKIEKEIIVVPYMPPTILNNKSSVLEEMFNSLI